MERIEEFTLEGKNFMYIDLSNIVTNDDFLQLTAIMEPLMEKYPEHSLYTITNIEGVRVNAHTKELVAKCLAHNKPYVKYGAIVGLDGIKKVFTNSALKMSGRTNMHFAFSKEKAIEWLLMQD